MEYTIMKKSKIKSLKKLIEDQKLIHKYIQEGKDLSELRIKLAQPL